MRLIKVFLTGLIGLFIIITLLSLLLPSEIKVSRAVVINASHDKIVSQLNDLKNWKNWEPMFASDSVAIHFSEPSNVINSVADITYKEKQAHVTINSMDSSSVKFLLQAKGENDIANEISVTTLDNNKGQLVEWKALTKLHWYPWDKLYGIFIDRLTGPGYEDALDHLKSFVER